MKHTAIFLAILMTFSLTACSLNGKPSNSGSKPSNNSSTVKPNTDKDKDKDKDTGTDKDLDTDLDNESKPDTILPDTDTDDKDKDTNTDSDMNTKPDTDKPDDMSENRRFMYAGKLYTVTDEKVAQDKVGAELFSISSMIDGDPAEDGDAVGLDEGVRIFKLVEENEYREVAVEIDSEYYLARMDEDAPANVG